MSPGAPFVGIGRYVRVGAAAHPHRPALELAAGARRTYLDLDTRSERQANALLGLGCAPGDRVGIFHVLGDADARVVGPEVHDRVDALTSRPTLIGVGVRAAGVRKLEGLILAGSPRRLPDPGPDELLILGYTSGTTGSPKGAELTHGAVERLALTNALSCRYVLGGVHVFVCRCRSRRHVPHRPLAGAGGPGRRGPPPPR